MARTVMEERSEAAALVAQAMLALAKAHAVLRPLPQTEDARRAHELWEQVADFYREVAP